MNIVNEVSLPKILFLHGFFASGQCVPAVALREAFTGRAEVVTPDLPMHPKEAVSFIRELTDREQPDLLIGNSCGAFYAQMVAPLAGLPALLGNPHFRMTEFLRQRIGEHQYKSPRKDGNQKFVIDEDLIEEFAEMEAIQFDGCRPDFRDRIWGLFGEHDTLAHFEPLFLEHYTHSFHFPGAHTPTAEEVRDWYVPLAERLLKVRELHRNKMNDSYALFFDIDGTLVSFKTHEIPDSTIQALTQAKKNGSRVYIATGRPPIIITNLGSIAHLIDGYISTNGALCYVGDELVCCQPIPKEDVMTCVEDSKEKGYSLIVVGRKDVAVLDPTGNVNRIFRQMLAVKEFDKVSPLSEVLKQDILQLTPFFTTEYEAELLSRLPHCISGRWHPEFTDITANGADKGKGIITMAKHEGFDPSRTIAFGDGGNDSSMILQAGIGVAMGNAIDALKQQADYVTTSVDDDGILNALRHFNVI